MSSTISDKIADMCYHDFIPSPNPSNKPLRDYFDVAHLNEAHKNAIFTVIEDYPEVFLTDGKKLICTDVMEFDVELDTDRPIARPPYPAPKGYEKDFDRLIQAMIDDGILEHTTSGYAAPAVLVHRRIPDGSIKLRIVFDYRALNAAILPQVCVPIHIQTLVSSFYNSKIFTVLDFVNGFWQIRLTERAKQKLA